MIWTDDPVRDAERYFLDWELKLERLPLCCICGDPIQDEKALYLNDEWICDSCVDDNRRWVEEDY